MKINAGLVETRFSVGQSVFEVPYPGIARRGDKVRIDGVDFIVAEDGVVVFSRHPFEPDKSRVYVEAPLGTEYTEAQRG